MCSKRSSKKLWMVLFGVVLCFVASLVIFNNNSFATTSDEVVETNLFGNFVDDGEGCGVYKILNLVIDILSMGIAIVGIIGVTIVGIQYLTAKDSEEKTRKAKNRMLEIVIGLVAYAVLFAAVQWLLPGGMMNKNCTTVTDEQLAKMKEEERKKEQEKQEKEEKKDEKKSEEETKKEKKEDLQKEKAKKKCMERAAKVVRDKICDIEDPAKRISMTARLLAGSWTSPSSAYIQAMKEIGSYGNGGSKGQQKGNSCDVFVHTVLIASGVDTGVPNNLRGSNTKTLYNYFKNHPKKWKQVKFSNRTEGDVTAKPLTDSAMGHVSLVIRNKSGKLVTAEASNPGKNWKSTGFPVVQAKLNSGSLYSYSVWRYIGK